MGALLIAACLGDIVRHEVARAGDDTEVALFRMIMQRLRFLRTTFMLYVLAILLLTLGKTWFAVGRLWTTGAHQNRSIHLVPFWDFVTATTWFAPTLNLVGNVMLFIPFGALLAFLWSGARSGSTMFWRVTGTAFVFSLVLEALQFVFGIGYSDSGDLIANTVGAYWGVRLARWLLEEASLRKCQFVVYCFSAISVMVFALLIRGSRLREFVPHWSLFA